MKNLFYLDWDKSSSANEQVAKVTDDEMSLYCYKCCEFPMTNFKQQLEKRRMYHCMLLTDGCSKNLK